MAAADASAGGGPARAEGEEPEALRAAAPAPASAGAERLAREVGAAVRQAPDLAALAGLSGTVRHLAALALAQGVPAGQLTRLVAALGDQVAARAIELGLAGAAPPGMALCWLALGSEGRREQTLASEQHNGLVFEAGARDPEEARALLLPVARRANEALAACGFPLGRAGAMAGTADWCLSLGEWRERLARWLSEPLRQWLPGAAACCDLRPLHGSRALADGLRAWLAAAAPRSPRFLLLLGEATRRRRVPLGIVRDFAVDADGEAPGTIDLHGGGAAVFVEAARLLALATGSAAHGTVERLRQGGLRLGAPQDEVEGWVEGFHQVQALRLRLQVERGDRCHSAHDRFDPRVLAPADRRLLKGALRQAAALQKRVLRAFGDAG